MKKTYIILDGVNNLVKIGESENPKERLKQFQTANPNKLELVGMTDEPEGVVHNRFRGDRARGEWFEYSDEIRRFVQEVTWKTEQERVARLRAKEAEAKKRKQELEELERETARKLKEERGKAKKRKTNILRKCREYLIDLKKEFPLDPQASIKFKKKKCEAYWGRRLMDKDTSKEAGWKVKEGLNDWIDNWNEYNSDSWGDWDKDGFKVTDFSWDFQRYSLYWMSIPLVIIRTKNEPDDTLRIAKKRLRKRYEEYYNYRKLSRWRRFWYWFRWFRADVGTYWDW